jgi:UbiD family decarboxylase
VSDHVSCPGPRRPGHGRRRSLPTQDRACPTPHGCGWLPGLGNKGQIELLLGLAKNTSDKAIVRHLKETFRKPMPPRIVRTGPVKETILTDEEINLWDFPAPKWHKADGGRYIDTFCGVVTQDRTTGRDNIWLYRRQIIGRRPKHTRTSS